MSRRTSFGLIFGFFAFFFLLHYACQVLWPGETQWHNVFVKFLFIPVVLAAFLWGLRGGLLLGGLSALVSLGDMFRYVGPNHPEFLAKAVEMVLFVAVGALLGALVDRQRQAKRRGFPLERRSKAAYKKSVIDPLTHAYNRSFMGKMLKSHFEDALQHNHYFCLMMLDINGFKAINAGHGHPAGDRVLQSTVQTIANQVRKTDLICRYGGDEFLVILPNCRENQALDLALRLRHEMAKVTFSNVKGPFKADFSIGVVEFRKDYQVLPKMLDKLGEALYRAKQEESRVAKAG